MRRAMMVAALMMLALVPISSAAAPVASGTITGPNESQPYAFGQAVTFTTTATGLKGNQYPMVYLECYSVVDGTLLYGQLDYPTTPFQLGGGSSKWHLQRDDATCIAHLFAYGGKYRGNELIVELTSPISFPALG